MERKVAAPRILKIALLWLGCIGLRALPWRIPNVEPVMAATLPIGATSGVIASVVFPATVMVAFDVMGGAVGIWTPVTALAYAAIGLLSSRLFAGKTIRFLSGAFFAVYATILYDVVTAALGPLAFGQGWIETYVGQIPFTVNHVLGNVVLCGLLSPLLQRWLAAAADPSFGRRRSVRM